MNQQELSQMFWYHHSATHPYVVDLSSSVEIDLDHLSYLQLKPKPDLSYLFLFQFYMLFWFVFWPIAPVGCPHFRLPNPDHGKHVMGEEGTRDVKSVMCSDLWNSKMQKSTCHVITRIFFYINLFHNKYDIPLISIQQF